MNGQQEFVDALLNPGQPLPASITTWNGSDPAARFAVYRNNVVVSLIDALADTYPVTQELVGEEFFRAMARLFVYAEPPRSRMLAFYGETFPAFIEQFPPAASVPYLADMARLEILRVRAYHAADIAGLPTDAIALALADADGLPNLLVELQPSVGLVRSQYAVVSLWAAHQGAADISTVDPFVSEHALVIRQALDVEVIRLNTGAADFIARLLQGQTLGCSTEQACQTHPDFDLPCVLGLLIQSRAISSMQSS